MKRKTFVKSKTKLFKI